MAKIRPYSELSQEERDEMRRASRQMADSEYMTEVQNKLPEVLRFGGDYGLVSALGYGKGDDRTKINSYVSKLPPDYLLSPYAYYIPKNMRDEDIDRELRKIKKFADYVGEPPRQGGIAALLPTGNSEVHKQYREGNFYEGDSPAPRGYSRSVAHELTHKGFKHPVVAAALQDFIDRDFSFFDRATNESIKFDKLAARRMLENMGVSQEHRFLDDIQPELGDTPQSTNFYRGRRDAKLLDRIVRDFMSREENKERYSDVYIPTRSAQPEEPSILDRLISLVKG